VRIITPDNRITKGTIVHVKKSDQLVNWPVTGAYHPKDSLAIVQVSGRCYWRGVQRMKFPLRLLLPNHTNSALAAVPFIWIPVSSLSRNGLTSPHPYVVVTEDKDFSIIRHILPPSPTPAASSPAPACVQWLPSPSLPSLSLPSAEVVPDEEEEAEQIKSLRATNVVPITYVTKSNPYYLYM